jgi:hypothetical protein
MVRRLTGHGSRVAGTAIKIRKDQHQQDEARATKRGGDNEGREAAGDQDLAGDLADTRGAEVPRTFPHDDGML